MATTLKSKCRDQGRNSCPKNYVNKTFIFPTVCPTGDCISRRAQAKKKKNSFESFEIEFVKRTRLLANQFDAFQSKNRYISHRHMHSSMETPIPIQSRDASE